MRRIIFCMVFCLMAITSWAVKADPTPVTITQPDGSRLTVILNGDEHHHWYSTLDGVLLVQKGAAYYIADTQTYGELSATSQLAHEAPLRQESERMLIGKQDRDAYFSAITSLEQQNTAKRRAQHIKNDKTLFPHAGSPKVLILLVDFPDEPFSLADPKKSFEQYLNGEGEPQDFGNRENANYGSVKEYFSDCSRGQFSPQFDIYGPYRMPDELHTVYGLGSDDIAKLMTDACNMANDEVNFADYDANNDGYVDLVYIIYAGYSASIVGNKETCIWPKSGTQNFGSWDGKKVYRYGVNNELNGTPDSYTYEPKKRMNGIGLFCHEFSHCMGLPDLYPSKTASGYKHNNQGMEVWDVMDTGCYNNTGYCPAPYTAWEREVMGWISIEEIKDNQTSLTLDCLENPAGKAYKIVNPTNEREYVILQNYQNFDWSQVIGRIGYRETDTSPIMYSDKAHGLFVYRICYASDEVNLFDYPNNILNQARVLALPAYGDLLNQDITSSKPYCTQFANHTYPGAQNITSIDGFTLLDGSTLKCSIGNITENDQYQVVLEDISIGEPTGIKSIGSINQLSDKRIYTLDGRYMGTSTEGLMPGLYIQGNRKMVIKDR